MQPAPDMVKLPSLTLAYVGGEVDWVLRGFHNRSGEVATGFAITDMPGRGLNFTRGQIPAFANGEGVTFDILYTVYGSDVWHTFATGLDASQPHNFELPQTGDIWYTNIQLYFGDVPAGFGLGDEIVLTFVAGADAPDGLLENHFAVRYSGNQRMVGSPYRPVVAQNVPQQTAISPASTAQQSVGNLNPQTSDDFNIIAFIIFASGALISLGAFTAIVVRRKQTVR